MGSFIKLDGKVTAIESGTTRILKSSGVAAMVDARGAKVAASANALAGSIRSKGESPKYEADGVEMRYLHGCRVHPTNYAAGIDNNVNDTLKKAANV